LVFTLVFCIPADGISQSPKKLLANGFHEQAFVNAVYKQNKKVKLKKKYTEVIYPSYDIIYSKNSEIIASTETTWQQSYNALILTSKYRAKVTHPGVYDKLTNILYDKANLDHIGTKFNDSNQKDLGTALTFESQGKFDKALEIYQVIEKRHQQATPITTLGDRLLIIDYEAKIDNVNQQIGDQYLVEATNLIGAGTVKSAKAAIKLIEKARTYRPLDMEEEALLELAHLIMSNSMMEDAKKLLKTPTKKNARLAFELIESVRKMRTLSPEEERLSEKARDWGTTRILVTIKGSDPVNSKESVSGFLNKSKDSKWVNFYNSNQASERYDFEMEITENQPKVILGKRRKEVSQHTKTVEVVETETDNQGNTTQVTKTKPVIAIVAVFSRTKSATLNWSIVLKDLSDSKSAFSEN